MFKLSEKEKNALHYEFGVVVARYERVKEKSGLANARTFLESVVEESVGALLDERSIVIEDGE